MDASGVQDRQEAALPSGDQAQAGRPVGRHQVAFGPDVQAFWIFSGLESAPTFQPDLRWGPAKNLFFSIGFRLECASFRGCLIPWQPGFHSQEELEW